jgi:hypothetical protein
MLDEAQTAALRRVLDIALAVRVAGRANAPPAAAAFGGRLRRMPVPDQDERRAKLTGQVDAGLSAGIPMPADAAEPASEPPEESEEAWSSIRRTPRFPPPATGAMCGSRWSAPC